MNMYIVVFKHNKKNDISKSIATIQSTQFLLMVFGENKNFGVVRIRFVQENFLLCKSS